MMTEHTKSIIAKAGGAQALAKRLGVSRQAVQKWHVIPAHWVRTIEDITGVPAEEIRPDIFGRPRLAAGPNRVAA